MPKKETSSYPEIKNKARTNTKERNLQELYFTCYVLKQLRHPVQKSTRIDIKNRLDSLQNVDGGFGVVKSDILTTYYAIKTYKTLGVDIPNRVKTIKWLISHQSQEGLFEVQGHTDMVINYLFVDNLNELNYQISKKQNLIEWIMTCKNETGTFQMAPGNAMDFDSDPLLSTYAALFLLSQLSGTCSH